MKKFFRLCAVTAVIACLVSCAMSTGGKKTGSPLDDVMVDAGGGMYNLFSSGKVFFYASPNPIPSDSRSYLKLELGTYKGTTVTFEGESAKASVTKDSVTIEGNAIPRVTDKDLIKKAVKAKVNADFSDLEKL